MKPIAALRKRTRLPRQKYLIVLSILTCNTLTSATPPSISPPRPPEKICFDSEDSVFLPAARGKSISDGSFHCRDELVWREQALWVCRFHDQLLLSDAPLDRALTKNLSIPPVAQMPQCLPIEAQRCGARTQLITSKICLQNLKSESTDFWRRFAEDANRSEQPLQSSCSFLEQQAAQYLGLHALFHCSRESCLLEQEASFNELLGYIRSNDSSKALTELIAVEIQFSFSDQPDVTEQLTQAGVYCLASQAQPAIAASTPHPPRIASAQLLQTIPQHWSAVRSIFQPRTSQSADNFLLCKSDLDCVPGKRPGVCMHKALATGHTKTDTASHRCECVQGPVVHGCVARRSTP